MKAMCQNSKHFRVKSDVKSKALFTLHSYATAIGLLYNNNNNNNSQKHIMQKVKSCAFTACWPLTMYCNNWKTILKQVVGQLFDL